MIKKSLKSVLVTILVISMFAACKKDENKPTKLVSISIKTPPTKTNYVMGETIDLSGLEVTLVMSDGATKIVTFLDFADKGITCSPENGSKVNTSLKEVRIIHIESGISESQNIKVDNIVVTDISLKTSPLKVNYYEGDNLDLTGLVVTLTKNNGETEDFSLSDFSDSGISCSPKNGAILEISSTTVTIKYLVTNVNTSMNININKVIVNAISIKTPPTIVDFFIGEVLDLTGLSIMLTMNKGNTEVVAFQDFSKKGITCSPANGTILNSLSTEITCTHTETGNTTNQKIKTNDGITDIEGNRYPTIKIGSQTWMASNLKTTKYNNGDVIETTNPASLDIQLEVNPKYQWAIEGDENNVKTYGRLYTWFVLTDSRNVCPTEWHVPTKDEWTVLQNFLKANGYNYDGSTIDNIYAKSLATDYGWTSSTVVGSVGNTDYPEKINLTGFSALPGGYRWSNGSFFGVGVSAYWWSSTEIKSIFGSHFYIWNNNSEAIISDLTSKNSGLAVRCVKN